MTRRHKKGGKSQTKLQDFVIVTIAEDSEQARDHEALLKNNDIPATVREQDAELTEGTPGFAVMVPEEFLDEAHVIIESQDAYDDFYDFALEDEDEGGFDGDLFEDEF
jgi:hypothetical protein